MELSDVPCPPINDNEILGKNIYLIISPGTESKTVSNVHKGYIEKARARQNEFKAVVKVEKSERIINTLRQL